jgi:hypothetical protein
MDSIKDGMIASDVQFYRREQGVYNIGLSSDSTMSPDLLKLLFLTDFIFPVNSSVYRIGTHLSYTQVLTICRTFNLHLKSGSGSGASRFAYIQSQQYTRHSYVSEWEKPTPKVRVATHFHLVLQGLGAMYDKDLVEFHKNSSVISKFTYLARVGSDHHTGMFLGFASQQEKLRCMDDLRKGWNCPEVGRRLFLEEMTSKHTLYGHDLVFNQGNFLSSITTRDLHNISFPYAGYAKLAYRKHAGDNAGTGLYFDPLNPD